MCYSALSIPNAVPELVISLKPEYYILFCLVVITGVVNILDRIVKK